MLSSEKLPSLNQIRYFVQVARHLSYRKAAHLLGVSQPTLTSQISAMEQMLGVVLFERSRSGTRLSVQGRTLLPSAEAVLLSNTRFTEAARSLADGDNMTYRLGVPPTLGPYLLPHILPQLHALYPGLKFYVREGAPQQLQQGLLSGEYDLIVSPLSDKNSQIIVQPLFTEPLKLVLPVDHRLAGHTFVSPDELKGEKVLTLEDRHHFHYQVQEICDLLGADVERDYEGTSLDTLRQMVVMGMGIAFLPGLYIHSEIHRPEALHVCELKDMPIVRQHVLAWRNTSPNRAFFRELAHTMKVIVQTELFSAVLVSKSGEN